MLLLACLLNTQKKTKNKHQARVCKFVHAHTMNNRFLQSCNTKILPSLSLCGTTKTTSEHQHHLPWLMATSYERKIGFL
jgi:hypothetical protein